MTEKKKKTKDKIKEALTEMLDQKPYDDITAVALCAYAGVNRATFYYHYDSVDAVLAEMEEEMEREFTKWITQATINEIGAVEKSFYVAFFEFVARYAGVCRMLIGTKHKSNFLKRALEAGRTKVVSVMSRLYPDCPASKIDYYYIFVSNGFLGLLEYWLTSGMRESINEIAEIGEKVSSKGALFLQ